MMSPIEGLNFRRSSSFNPIAFRHCSKVQFARSIFRWCPSRDTDKLPFIQYSYNFGTAARGFEFVKKSESLLQQQV
mgnify:CR=1 FL=1